MKKTLLYIEQPHYDKKNGGARLDFRNEKILKEIFGENFVFYQIPKPNGFEKILQKLFCISDGYSFQVWRKIKQILKMKNIDYVFIPSSRYGCLIQDIKKKSECVVICYFANIEYHFAKDFCKWWNLKSLLLLFMCKKNEICAAKYSDYTIGLTNKDNMLFKKFYNREFNFLLPTTINDSLSVLKENEICLGKKALFVGANFLGNTQGLDWFINEVLPYADISLTIIGSGMDRYRKSTDKLNVFGFVDDLAEYYCNADFVISPIISGGGMKTKISEAMMYGKVILGTGNAFEGYEIENLPECIKCESADDFLREISLLPSKKFCKYNENVRQCFLSSYSDDAAKEKIFDFFNMIGK